MFDVGGGELLLILLAVLVLFGPKKIPEIAQMVGKGMQQVRKAQAQLQAQISEIQTDIKTVIEEAPEAVKTNPPSINAGINSPNKASRDIEKSYADNNGIVDSTINQQVEIKEEIKGETKTGDDAVTKSAKSD